MKEKINININNYEAYFLDYHEGNLSLDLVKELMDFLSQHPELKEEFESFDPLTLQDAEKTVYAEKEALKKQGINPYTFDNYAIEYIERTLPPVLQNDLKAFIIQNPLYKKELKLYQQTKLSPDTSIIFEDKHSLKKGIGRSNTWYYWAAAASVALIIGVYFVLNKNATPDANTLVKHNLIKDTDAIANRAVKTIDTTVSAQRKVFTPPVISKIKNNAVTIKTHFGKENRNEKTIPNIINRDSSAMVINKEVEDRLPMPVKKQDIDSSLSKNSSSITKSSMHDTSFVKKDVAKNNVIRPEVVTAKIHQESNTRKILVFMAALTCKGLHKLTGQHIELEKKFDSDTTNIVAYQLDLGNKKFQFPVRE